MTAPLELNSPTDRSTTNQPTEASRCEAPRSEAPRSEEQRYEARRFEEQRASESGATSGPTSINLLLAALLGAAIVAAFVGFGGDAAANGPLQPASAQSSVVDTIEIYVVQPGDTLWSIATEVSVDGEDIRPLVDHLKEVAGGSSIDVGQRIVIDHATIRS